MKTTQRRWFVFFLGVAILPTLILAHHYLPSSDTVIQVGGLIFVIALLPFVFLKLKKQAVPAKKSDLIGYAVIFAVCVAVALVTLAALR